MLLRRLLITVAFLSFAAAGAAARADAAVTGTLSAGALRLEVGAEAASVFVGQGREPGEVDLHVDKREDPPAAPGAFVDVPGCPPAEHGTALVCPGVTSVEIVGGPGDDALAAVAPVPAIIQGGDGADRLTGGPATTTLIGGPGDDVLDDEEYAPGPGDVFDGGEGDDTIISRDGLADTVLCGGGTDVARTDTAIEAAQGCEGLHPELIGPLTYSGWVAGGQTATIAEVGALGAPAPVVTYGWRICSHYWGCRQIAAGRTHTFTVEEIHAGAQYRSTIDGYAEAVNAFGTDVLHARWDGVTPAYQQLKGVPPDVPAQAGPAFDSRAVAGRLLPGRLTPVGGLSDRSLTAFRRPGRTLLSRRGATLRVALVCGSGLCQVSLRPSLVTRGRRALRRGVQRVRIRAGEGVVLRVSLTKAQRSRLRRARRGTLRLGGTLRVGGANSALSADLPVR